MVRRTSAPATWSWGYAQPGTSCVCIVLYIYHRHSPPRLPPSYLVFSVISGLWFRIVTERICYGLGIQRLVFNSAKSARCTDIWNSEHVYLLVLCWTIQWAFSNVDCLTFLTYSTWKSGSLCLMLPHGRNFPWLKRLSCLRTLQCAFIHRARSTTLLSIVLVTALDCPIQTISWAFL